MDLIEGLLSLDSKIDATKISEILWLAKIMQGSEPFSNKYTTENITTIIKSGINHSRVRKKLQNDNMPQENIHEVVISRANHKQENGSMTFENAGKIPTFVASMDDKNIFSSIVKYLEEFKIKQKIQSNVLLDENKTAEYMANTEIMNPKFKLEKRKISYFALNLIIDRHESMFVWQEMIDIFKKDIKLSNVFRQVNLIFLDSSSNKAKLSYALSERPLSASSSIFSDKRSITIFVSDIIGNAWKSNSVFSDLIQHWINKTFVCIVSLLPKKYWQRTPLSQGSRNLVYSSKKLPKNSDLNVKHNFIEKELSKKLSRIPVMTPEGTSLLYLSYLLNAKKNKLLNAYIFEQLEVKEVPQKPTDSPTLNEVEQKVEKFFSIISVETKYLAIYCSVLPLHPQIVKDVIRVKKLGNVLETFAEFTYGDLLDRTNGNNKYKYYDFYPNVRRVLMRYINMSEIESIYKILDNNIKQALGISKSFLELLYEADIEDEQVGKIEKELIEILINVLKEKGSIVEQAKINKLMQKINTVYPEKNWFFMGSDDGDDDEKPVHEVVFNYDFEIAKYPVTFEEYDLFCEDTGKEKPNDNGWGRGRRPVINVSWHDAKEYCKWLSKKTGKNYRLPTEAEWEYSCRAGTTTKWSFGDDESELKKYAWYYDNSKGRTHEAGKKEPNLWGLYDMHGNVWEWCEDDYVNSYEKTPRYGKAYIDEKAAYKVLRGASWYDFAINTRSSNRNWSDPAIRSIDVGFRVLRTLPSDMGDFASNDTVNKSEKKAPKRDVTFKCEECSTPYALDCDELDWEVVESQERQMGAEVNYEAYSEIDCDRCGNNMSLTFSCWEYPVGAENFRDVQGVGVEDIKGDCCLDFHESDKKEYIQESIAEIKKWFFENYEDLANSLPYESKVGGYQWIHGEPVDTEEAIYEHFYEKHSEEILKEAIDEIGRYEQWSPIPQNEEEFQKALGNWAKKKQMKMKTSFGKSENDKVILPEFIRIIHSKREKSFTFPMIKLPKGKFTFGEAHYKIDYDLEIGKYPVTVGEFAYFIEDTGYKTEAERGKGAYIWKKNGVFDLKKDASWKNPYFEQTSEHPVVCVTLKDIKKYIEWLNNKTNKTYRLPTEEEWEYAALSMSGNPYGTKQTNDLKKIAWFYDNSNEGTHSIGEKLPNEWGIYDMFGNVWEWCEPESLKGGSWGSVKRRVDARFEARWYDIHCDNKMGFRIVCTDYVFLYQEQAIEKNLDNFVEVKNNPLEMYKEIEKRIVRKLESIGWNKNDILIRSKKGADIVLLKHNVSKAIIEIKIKLDIEKNRKKYIEQLQRHAKESNVSLAYITDGDKIYKLENDTGEIEQIDKFPTADEISFSDEIYNEVEKVNTTASDTIIIKAIGVGGGGGNAINYMINEGISGIDFIVANTDAQALETSVAPLKIQLGINAVRGLGAGMVLEKGREAALESFEEIKSTLTGADMVFVVAGMGGGTGTGAAPIIAQAAREVGALTVSIVTSPFKFEGRKRTRLAKDGLEELKKKSDSVIVVANEKLLLLAKMEENLGIKESFKLVDDILAHAVDVILKVIFSHGDNDINLDFDDMRTVMGYRGLALLGVGRSTGASAAYNAAKMALESPLLGNISISRAMGILVHFEIHPDYSIIEISRAMDLIEEDIDEDVSVIFGTTTDLKYKKDEVKITIVAAGLDDPGSFVDETHTLSIQAEIQQKRQIVDGQFALEEEILDLPVFLRKQMD